MFNCMIKPFYSSLPFWFACVSRVWFSPFWDDHQFIDVSRCENSWWSQWRRGCCNLVGHGLVLDCCRAHVEELLLYCNPLLMSKLLVVCWYSCIWFLASRSASFFFLVYWGDCIILYTLSLVPLDIIRCTMFYLNKFIY